MYCNSCGNLLPENSAFCGKCGKRIEDGPSTPPNKEAVPGQTSVNNTNSESDTLLAVFANLGGIIFFFIPSLVVYLTKKGSGGWVVESAREALNWQISAAIYSFVLGISVVGLLLIWVVYVLDVVFCLIGAIKCGDRIAWRYPLTIRLIK